jgi:two-component SAPR family response regulator
MRFLFLSGFSPAASQIQDVLEQGLELIQKPVSPDALLRAVRRTLDA